MSSIVKAVFFDWAGTMVDFGSRAPLIAMQSVFADAGVAVTEAAVRAHMGKAKRAHVLAIFEEPGVGEAWKAAHGQMPTEADADALMVDLEPAMAREAAKASTLIPGAKNVFDGLIAAGIKVGSSTGYTQTMMADVARLAAEQGYRPQTILCAGDTSEGRPAPLMLWQAMVNLGVWPARACVAVDDAPVGIVAGREAGMWTIGLAGSGNALGLDAAAYGALSDQDRRERLAQAAQTFIDAGATIVIATIADLPEALAHIEAAILADKRPGDAPSVLSASVTT
jgi:phosphonoacetaldehyde hydrolase